MQKKIELISKTTGVIKEYSLDHAIRILNFQKDTGTGTKEIFNTILYEYDEGNTTIRERPVKPRSKKHSPNGGESLSETVSAAIIGQDEISEES